MIKNTRLATEEEKSVIISYILGSNRNSNASFFLFKNAEAHFELANSASFIILEVNGLESKIVVVNYIVNNTGAMEDVMDINTAHYLLNDDNTIVDISNPDLLKSW